MQYFDLKVGYSCNNDCIHCVVADKRETEDLTTEKIKEIIRGRGKNDVICFTGGEPTIRSDFIEIIKYAKERCGGVVLQTNGVRFSDEDFAREAAKYIDSILIAVHSFNSRVHDKIVQQNGMHDKTVRGLKNIVKLKIPHKTQTVISSLNINYLKETYDFIQSISPDTKMNMTYPHLMGNAYNNKELVSVPYSKIKKDIHRALEAYGDKIDTEAIPPCYLYPFHDIVKSSEEDLIELKKKKEKRMQGVDFGDKLCPIKDDYVSLMLSDRRKGFKCGACIFNEKCAGVWKEYIEIYRDNLDLIPITKY